MKTSPDAPARDNTFFVCAHTSRRKCRAALDHTCRVTRVSIALTGRPPFVSDRKRDWLERRNMCTIPASLSSSPAKRQRIASGANRGKIRGANQASLRFLSDVSASNKRYVCVFFLLSTSFLYISEEQIRVDWSADKLHMKLTLLGFISEQGRRQ